MKTKIYIIKDGEYIKIGYAMDVLKRLGTLQVGNPRELSIVFSKVTRNPKRDEARVHYRLTQYKVRGEWFKCDINLAKQIILETIGGF